jgi:hypothetical protein
MVGACGGDSSPSLLRSFASAARSRMLRTKAAVTAVSFADLFGVPILAEFRSGRYEFSFLVDMPIPCDATRVPARVESNFRPVLKVPPRRGLRIQDAD